MFWYRLTKWGVWVTAPLFLLISLAGLPLVSQENVFPFFTWSLFSWVDRTSVDFAVRVTSVDGQPLTDGEDFMRSQRFHVGGDKAYFVLQAFGRAVKKKSPQAEGERKLFERFLGGFDKTLEYELLVRRWNALEFWKTGKSHPRLVQRFKVEKEKS